MSKLWGGRFKKPIDADFECFSRSIRYDYLLAEYDVYHSLIHTRALVHAEILNKSEAATMGKALSALLREIQNREYEPAADAEDVHTDIQNRLEKKVGALALKLHTLRSRNDQIAFDAKFFCLQTAVEFKRQLESVLEAATWLGKEYVHQPFVGYTHLQHAQVVLFRDYINAYFSMFKRDMERMKHYGDGLIPCIGAGALAGSSISRKHYTAAIKDVFGDDELPVRPIENSLDQVSDRDFMLELLSMLSIIQMHISRLAEDFILYSSQEFNLLDLPEEFCTGSSLMPHKKNPDFLELCRGYTGPVYGQLMALLTTMKALPLTYNRDMQLDKEPVFTAVSIVRQELAMLPKFLRGVRLNEAALNAALADERLYATELAEFLVFEGVSFRQAHEIIGRLVRESEDHRVAIKEMTDEQLQQFHPSLNRKEVCRVMTARHAVSSKKTISRRTPKINA